VNSWRESRLKELNNVDDELNVSVVANAMLSEIERQTGGLSG
jgi:hypothetical protein